MVPELVRGLVRTFRGERNRGNHTDEQGGVSERDQFTAFSTLDFPSGKHRTVIPTSNIRASVQTTPSHPLGQTQNGIRVRFAIPLACGRFWIPSQSRHRPTAASGISGTVCRVECRWLCQLLHRSGSEASHRKVRKLHMRSVRQGSPLADGVKLNDLARLGLPKDFRRSVVAILRRIRWDLRPKGARLESPGRQPWGKWPFLCG